MSVNGVFTGLLFETDVDTRLKEISLAIAEKQNSYNMRSQQRSRDEGTKNEYN